jgi:hypothetical protein
MSRRSYAGGAAPTTLTSPITTGSNTATLADGTGYPDTSGGPFALVIDRGLSTEEKVLVSTRTGNAITFAARGYDGTASQNHSSGATVEHIATAIDHDEANDHVNATAGVHGLDPGDRVVGRATSSPLTNKQISSSTGDFTTLRRGGVDVVDTTSAQTLSSKILNSPIITGTMEASTINANALNVGGVMVVTLTGNQTLQNKTLNAAILAGTTTNTGTLSGGTVDAPTVRKDGHDVATLDGTETLTNKTLTSPALTDPVLTGVATLGGRNLAVARFSPVYQQETSPSTSLLGVPGTSVELSRLFVTPGADNQVEAMFNWYGTELVSGSAGAGDRHKIYLAWQYTAIGVDTVIATYSLEYNGFNKMSGGTVRGLFRPDTSAAVRVTAYLEVVATNGSGTYRVYANAVAPMTMSARPTAL